MKIYKDLYWLIISPSALFRAWEVFKSDKKNKLDVIDFELELEKNIFDLYRDLKNGTYKHGPYKGFWIHDLKLRRIHKATVRDRVLHHAIFNVLNPIFEPTFIPNSFSCRIGKGTHRGMKKVAEMLRIVSQNNTRQCYALKCDIKKFFDSIDHDILIKIIDKRIKDKKVMVLMREIVESYVASRPNLFERRGVPIGNLTSQVFANIYMNEFDQFAKQILKIKYYARYTDDFIVVSTNKTYLENLIVKIQEFLRIKLYLELHPKKVTITKHIRGVDFLGYVILPKHIKLRTKTKRKIPKKIHQMVERYKQGKITELTLYSSLQSYLGVLSHANAYNLSQEIQNKFWFWLNE
ncbi:MAG: reverse transcriptase domain-containing protein [Candidatus Paceibacterota bacterium]|jgi:retron-type reverse transcriptase